MGRRQKRATRLQIDEQFIKDEQKQAECWTECDEKLFSQMQNTDFDERFYQDIGNAVKELKCKSLLDVDDILDAPLTMQEVSKVVQLLPNCETSGFDGITYEHIKHRGSKLIESLLYLYRNIIEKEYIPRAFILAAKVLIPKGRKVKMTFDDSRGNNLLPVLDEVLERLVLGRIKCKCHKVSINYKVHIGLSRMH